MRIPDEPAAKAKDAARPAAPGSGDPGATDDSAQPAASAAA